MTDSGRGEAIFGTSHSSPTRLQTFTYSVMSAFSSECHLQPGPNTLETPDAFLSGCLLLIAFHSRSFLHR